MNKLKVLAFLSLFLLSPDSSYAESKRKALCEFEGISSCTITIKLPEPYLKSIARLPSKYDYAVHIKGRLENVSIDFDHENPAPPPGFCEVRFQCKKGYTDTYMLFPIN